MLNECNGCEYQCNLSHIDICTLGSPCPHQRSTPMTEQEYLQSCNTEQLAKWIIDITQYCFECGLNINNCLLCPFGKCGDVGSMVEWLKEIHNE